MSTMHRHRPAQQVLARIVAAALVAISVTLGMPGPGTAATPTFAFSVDAVQGGPGQIAISGWLFDTDAPHAPAEIHAYVGGGAGDPNAHGFPVLADSYRPDVHAVYGTGTHHGFYAQLPVSLRGAQPVHLYAINVPGSAGGNLYLGNYPVTVTAPEPEGNLEHLAVAGPGLLGVAGWAVDPNVPVDPLQVDVLVNRITTRSLRADGHRPDVAQHNPAYGPYHGFSATVPVPAGTAEFCVVARNVSHGQDSSLGCRVLTVPPVDTTAPETQIGVVVSETFAPSRSTVQFSSEPGAAFTCRWGSQAWFPCTSPLTTTLAAGTHTFSVRATDQVGNTDNTPATAVITVLAPAGDSPSQPTPPTDGAGGQRSTTVRVKAVRRSSRLRLDVGPDAARSSYKVKVQRWVGGRWKVVQRTRTRGTKAVRVLDLRRGRYRVVVPAQAGLAGSRSRAVRLRR